jgi:hypothetical protein
VQVSNARELLINSESKLRTTSMQLEDTKQERDSWRAQASSMCEWMNFFGLSEVPNILNFLFYP